MLQQTRVGAVIPYFQRFMDHFPDLSTLAEAPLDEVLGLWSGLGYYARARNLHRAARLVREQQGGVLPDRLDALRALPGIGRSTAGAILALSKGRREPILDGNVKRVLTRVHALEGWPGRPRVERRLWALAASYTPRERVGEYTQAMMDLGATLCTRRRPVCAECPLEGACLARAAGRQGDFPTPRPRKDLPVRSTTFLLLRNDQDRILLRQRPPTGVWGGLWGFPEAPGDADPTHWCTNRLGLRVQHLHTHPTVRHGFSHFHLEIVPWEARVEDHNAGVMEAPGVVWYKPDRPPPGGLAAPVETLLARIVGPLPIPSARSCSFPNGGGGRSDPTGAT